MRRRERMKRVLGLAVIATLGLLGIVVSTPGPDHKVDWCHYPPGQWTGDPAASHVLILSIDVSAEPGHLGHSPSLSSGTCNPSTGANCAEGVVDVATYGGNGCPRVRQSGPQCSDSITFDGFTLTGTYPNCVCPAGTQD